MAYAANEDGTAIYMATHRSTKKFRNLLDNPAVSLMIDTRDASPRSLTRALTIEGFCTRIDEDSERQLVRHRLLSIHPHLKEFLDHSDNEMLCVRIRSFLLLKGLTEAHRAELE
jgi:uncharacterized pyridoxamine 5'-phosphate oxidase family protein